MYDETTVSKLEEALAMGADVSAACSFANISRDTYYRWIKENQKLSDRFEQLKETPMLKAYATVVKDLDKVETAKWYLERRKKEFKPKSDMTSNDEGLQPILVKFIDGKDDRDTSRIQEVV